MKLEHRGSTSGRVLVVGGGIAGFAMMRALDQWGIPALLVDRLSGPPDAGLGLNLPGNAVRALRDLGVGGELKARGVPVRRREYRNAGNRLLFAIDEASFWDADAGSICALRGDVLELLRAEVSMSAVRWGKGVSAVVERGKQVEVSFHDTEVERYDFVVGADGVHSGVRTSVLGAAGRRAALLSAAGWRFMTTNPGVDCWSSWTGAAETFFLIPVDEERVYGFASPTKGRSVNTDQQWLGSAFGNYPQLVRSAVSSVLAEPSSLYYSPIEEVRLDSWHRGRVVLIGDAAHATSPVWAQGAALAAEDALVLAELLGTREDWTRVGSEFDGRRRPRVEHVQKMTDRLSRAAGLPGWLRDAILPVAGPRTYRETFGPLREPVVTSRFRE